MTRLHIAASPLSGTIYAGKPLKDGQWGAHKEDLTLEALMAVAEHVLLYNKRSKGKDVIITERGEPLYKITVEKL